MILIEIKIPKEIRDYQESIVFGLSLRQCVFSLLANSEFLIMLNQAPTDRVELARLLNISDNQLSYITNVPAGRGLMKCGSAIVPFEDSFPKQTKLYGLMTTKPSEISDTLGY